MDSARALVYNSRRCRKRSSVTRNTSQFRTYSRKKGQKYRRAYRRSELRTQLAPQQRTDLRSNAAAALSVSFSFSLVFRSRRNRLQRRESTGFAEANGRRTRVRATRRLLSRVRTRARRRTRALARPLPQERTDRPDRSSRDPAVSTEKTFLRRTRERPQACINVSMRDR